MKKKVFVINNISMKAIKCNSPSKINIFLINQIFKTAYSFKIKFRLTNLFKIKFRLINNNLRILKLKKLLISLCGNVIFIKILAMIFYFIITARKIHKKLNLHFNNIYYRKEH